MKGAVALAGKPKTPRARLTCSGAKTSECTPHENTTLDGTAVEVYGKLAEAVPCPSVELDERPAGRRLAETIAKPVTPL
jgi:hypothetical protein